MSENLTAAGEHYALEHAQQSIVARVALTGGKPRHPGREPWPATFVAAAIRECNRAGAARAIALVRS